MKKYTESHEWVECAGDIACVGITEFAVQEVGETVHAELPKVGTKLCAGDVAVVVESTKAAIDITSPVSGEVVSINSQLSSQIDKLNKFPESEGWLFKLRMHKQSELAGLLDKATYQKMLGN